MKIRRKPLNEQEETVMRLGREEKLTHEQLAQRIGVSKERVRQVVANARSRLRDFEENGPEALCLVPLRVRHFMEWNGIADRAALRTAMESGRLRWDESRNCCMLGDHSPRNIGWKSWEVMCEWVGRPRPVPKHEGVSPETLPAH